MNKPILTLILCALCMSGYAQAPYIQWQKCLGGSQLDEARYVAQTTDSGYIVAGVAQSNDSQVTGNHGAYDTWVVKLTPTGTIAWQKAYGGSASDNCNYIQQTADGGYVFASSSKSSDGDATFNNGRFDFWIVKLNPTGGLTWQKSLGGSNQDAVHCVKQTSDGGYIAVGRTNSSDGDITFNHGGYDMWVAKLSATGSLVWQKCYGGTGDEDGGAVVETYDGNFVIAGTSSSNDGDASGNHGGDDYWIIKISPTGTLIWQKSLGGTGDDVVIEDGGSGGLRETNDSGLIVTGWSDSNDGDVSGNHGSNDFWVAKMNATGSLVWQKSYGGTGDDEATSLYTTADGGYVVAGTVISNDADVSGNHGGYDYWVIKISDTGALQWQKCLGGTGISPGDCANAVQPAMGGGYIVAGFTSANDSDVSGNHGNFDYWVVKLNCLAADAGTLSGPTSVCKGATITLGTTVSGAAWSTDNGNTSVTGGIVTGVNVGVDTVRYTAVNTCGVDVATHTITVNPLPVPVIVATGTVLSTTVSFSSYQWLKSGTPITGATNATYTVASSGTYSVLVTDANGCTGTTLTMTIVPAGITNVFVGNNISILPNPTTGAITVTGIDHPKIKIYNTIGQLLQEGNTNDISIAAFPAGLYFVNVFNEQGALLKQEKVIKH